MGLFITVTAGFVAGIVVLAIRYAWTAATWRRRLGFILLGFLLTGGVGGIGLGLAYGTYAIDKAVNDS
ncbi:MAG: hypothetical protein JKY53_13255 [Flavobacteriales bacterium]|nr:hypothetical protein [Flavobacteriales bacterium]